MLLLSDFQTTVIYEKYRNKKYREIYLINIDLVGFMDYNCIIKRRLRLSVKQQVYFVNAEEILLWQKLLSFPSVGSVEKIK